MVITTSDKSKTAIFIGNRDCCKIDKAKNEQSVIQVIESGITCFLNGGHGYFDKTLFDEIIYPWRFCRRQFIENVEIHE